MKDLDESRIKVAALKAIKDFQTFANLFAKKTITALKVMKDFGHPSTVMRKLTLQLLLTKMG